MRSDQWHLLGLEPTTDKQTIKRAYAKQSQIYHPEENPEGFQALQKAYQAALAYQHKHAALSHHSEPLEHLNQSQANPTPSLDKSLDGDNQDTSTDNEKHSSLDWTTENTRTLESIGQDSEDNHNQMSFDSEDEQNWSFNPKTGAISPHRKPPLSLFRTTEDTDWSDASDLLDWFNQHLFTKQYQAAELKAFLNKASAQGALANLAVKTELEELILLSHFDRQPQNLEKMRQLAKRYHLTRLEQELAQTTNRQQPPTPDNAHKSSSTTKPNNPYLVYTLLILMTTVLYFTSYKGRHQIDTLQSLTRPSITIAQSLSQQQSVSSFLKTLITEPNLHEEAGSYYLIDPITNDRIPLIGVTQATVVTVEGDPRYLKVVLATQDQQHWSILDQKGNTIGELTDPIPSDSITSIILVYDLQHGFSVK